MARRTSDLPTTGPVKVPVRPRSRGRFVLGLFAMLASAGIALVTVTDPYAGATAAPFYQKPVLVKASGVQRYVIQGGYVDIDISRDSFKVVDAPVAPPQAKAKASGSSTSGGSAASYTTPVGTAQTYAAKAVASRGWAPSEFSCLVNLWNRESGWNSRASNPSGAYGIPRPSCCRAAPAGWQTDYRVQVRWGIGYIAARYGSPCGAWAHSNAAGFY